VIHNQIDYEVSININVIYHTTNSILSHDGRWMIEPKDIVEDKTGVNEWKMAKMNG